MSFIEIAHLLHTEKSFLNILESSQIWIIITLFMFIWYRTEFHLVSNELEMCTLQILSFGSESRGARLLGFGCNCINCEHLIVILLALVYVMFTIDSSQVTGLSFQ